MDTITQQKVAHLTSVHRASDTRIAHRECRTLVEEGYDVVLIAPGSGKGLPVGVRFHRLDAPSNRLERMTRTVWQVFRAALCERADVYHFHDPELLGVGLALRLWGARVIFDVHEDLANDIADKNWIPRVLRPPIAAGVVALLRSVHSCFNAVVTATPGIAERLPAKNTVVIRNYPRIEELALPCGGTFDQRPRKAVYLGSITELRGIIEMVQALSCPSMPSDVRLALAGDFESKSLEARVKAMPGWNRIDFAGWCDRAAVTRVLADARVGLLTLQPAKNFTDSLPVKLFEYMAAGLPVIISDTIKCSSIVREHECGLVVDPRDPEAIAGAIASLMDNPALAEAMGERGRRIALQRYQWASEALKLADLYAKIA